MGVQIKGNSQDFYKKVLNPSVFVLYEELVKKGYQFPAPAMYTCFGFLPGASQAMPAKFKLSLPVGTSTLMKGAATTQALMSKTMVNQWMQQIGMFAGLAVAAPKTPASTVHAPSAPHGGWPGGMPHANPADLKPETVAEVKANTTQPVKVDVVGFDHGKHCWTVYATYANGTIQSMFVTEEVAEQGLASDPVLDAIKKYKAAMVVQDKPATPDFPHVPGPKIQKKPTMPTVVPLRDAEAVGQKVKGTSPDSVYIAVALNPRVKIAARLGGKAMSLRAEAKNPTVGEVAALDKCMSNHKTHWSTHFDCGDVPPTRVLGAFLFGLGLALDDMIQPGQGVPQ